MIIIIKSQGHSVVILCNCFTKIMIIHFNSNILYNCFVYITSSVCLCYKTTYWLVYLVYIVNNLTT